LRAAAVTVAAFGKGRDLDPLFDPADRFFQVQLHHIADIGATPRAAARTATEDVAEDVAENVAHVGAGEAGPGVGPAHAVFERGVPMLVVHAALATVRQHFIGLLALLE